MLFVDFGCICYFWIGWMMLFCSAFPIVLLCLLFVCVGFAVLFDWVWFVLFWLLFAFDGFAWFVGFDWYTVCFDLDWLFGLCIDLLFCFLVVLVCVLFVWLWCLVFAWAIYLWCFVGCGYLHPLFALLFASVYDCDCLADICLLFNRVAGAVVSFGLNLSLRLCLVVFYVLLCLVLLFGVFNYWLLGMCCLLDGCLLCVWLIVLCDFFCYCGGFVYLWFN